jgi:hypothetical protein
VGKKLKKAPPPPGYDCVEDAKELKSITPIARGDLEPGQRVRTSPSAPPHLPLSPSAPSPPYALLPAQQCTPTPLRNGGERTAGFFCGGSYPKDGIRDGRCTWCQQKYNADRYTSKKRRKEEAHPSA